MLTGQIYYYLKTLDQISFPISPDQASRLEILGLPYVSGEAFAEIEEDEIPNEIKNLFISAYDSFLKENQLEICSYFWQWLTTPLKRQDIIHRIVPRSDYQAAIRQWGKDGFQFDQLSDIIASGRLVSREDDLALLYGLSFLDKFTLYSKDDGILELGSPKIQMKPESANVKYSTKPQILVLTSDELAPLFVNLGCEAIPLLHNKAKTLADLREVLKTEPTIKVVLIEGGDNEDYVAYIRTNIDSSILVSGFELPTSGQLKTKSNSQTYFDEIARATLGVRLD
jgi:vacuolar-type H+-ATPase subunit F/Vma7